MTDEERNAFYLETFGTTNLLTIWKILNVDSEGNPNKGCPICNHSTNEIFDFN